MEGDLDFVFGRGTAVFDRFQMHCLERATGSVPKGFVSTPPASADVDPGLLGDASTLGPGTVIANPASRPRSRRFGRGSTWGKA
ncbi:hypothetical protein [Glycomyces sp. TRM65418]|uniref:hypothetical protein n=1 Tax=Glycomyces sp. TRM65418 TaxID=2867006 RepID=UPI0035ABCDC1